MILSQFTDYQKKYMYPDTIFIIGGGPSLQQQQTQALQNPEHFVICCNQAFRIFPYARIAHHSDYSWWQQYQDELKQKFKGDLITGCRLGNTLDYPSNVTRLSTTSYKNHDELFKVPTLITGNNCGLQALALAHLFKPKNIVLIGFDFKANDHITHGYEKSDHHSPKHYQKFWALFLKDFKRFEQLKNKQWKIIFPNIKMPKIWNTYPDSALDLYDKSKKLSDFL